MKKTIILFALSLFLVSCSIKIKNPNNTGYEYLSPKADFVYTKKAPAVNLGVIESNKFNDNRILYEDNGVYNYYAYTAWLGSPVDIIKYAILQSINYIKLDHYAKYNLKIVLFDFEPHFNRKRMIYKDASQIGNEQNMYVHFKARVFLYDTSHRPIANKIFNYKVEFTQENNKAMLRATSMALDLFLKDLNSWLLGEIT